MTLDGGMNGVASETKIAQRVAGLLVVMERVMVEVEEDMTREEEISAPM